MSIRDEKDKQDRLKIEEYKKNPMINFADSINRSMIGNPGELTKGSGLTRIISTIIIIVLLSFLYLFFR
mgnify:CR=1 FL=1